MQNPTPIDFEQLKLTANKMHNRSHSGVRHDFQKGIFNILKDFIQKD